jgi:hypothetical protein
MSAPVFFHEKWVPISGWMAGKGMRLTVVLGSLLAFSILVNALIILAARGL